MTRRNQICALFGVSALIGVSNVLGDEVAS